MSTKFDIYEVAGANDLQVIETTLNRDGSGGGKKALIGFETFEDAEELARIYPNLRVTKFWRKDGYHCWVRSKYGEEYSGYTLTEEDFWDNCRIYTTAELDNFFMEEVAPQLENVRSFEQLEAIVKSERAIYDALKDMEDDELLITDMGEVDRIVSREVMAWSIDTYNYAIGVIEKETNPE